MNPRNHDTEQRTDAQKRAWDLLSAVEDQPQVIAWLEAEEAPARRFSSARVAAAAVLLAVGLTALAWLMRPTGVAYQTNVGEQRDVILPDGSKVTLNTNTALTVRYSDNRRYIQLERGEALFSVKHDTARPFDVAANHTLTRALGTEFNVDIRSTKVTVSVLEGAVRVAAANVAASEDGAERWSADDSSGMGLTPVAALSKGESIEIRSQDGQVLQEKADLKRIEAWRTRRLEFSDTSLPEAVEEFNRYSNTRIVIGTPELRRLRISGIIRIGDQDGFLFSLQRALRIESHESGNEIILMQTAAGTD